MRNELDLHNVRHADVPRSVDAFLSEAMLAGAFEVEIITGNSEAMRSVVRETLGDYGLVAARSPINPGKLIVRLA